MKQYLTLILLSILVVVSFTLSGCTSEETIAEKHVIETTYKNLMDRAEQLQGSNAFLRKGEIRWGFHSAVLDTMREAIYSDSGLGKSVELYLDGRDKEMEARNQSAGIPKDTFYKIQASSKALELLAQDEGNGLWILTISKWKWQYDERTNEVKARNNEAAKLLEEITLRTY